MPALEPVIVTLIVNTKEFKESLDQAKLELAGFGEGGVLGPAEGLAPAVGPIGTDAEQKMAGEGEKAAKKFEGGLHGGLGKLTGLLDKTGLPLGPLTEGLRKAGETSEELDHKSGNLFDRFAGVGKIATLGLAAGFAGAALEGMHLAQSMQSADAQLAVSEGISTSAAKKIGDAFLNTAGTTEFSGEEMQKAFAGVAGQLAATQGHALNSQQSLGFMTQAMELATAKGISLTSSTSSLAQVMQAFQLGTKHAAEAADILTSASNQTGQSTTAIVGALTKVRATLGGVSPSMGDLAGLLVDLTKHGETGRKAMAALQSTFTTFLKPVQALYKAQNELRVGTEDLPPSLRKLAAEYEKGNITSKEVSAATKGMTVTQAALWDQFKKGADATRMAYTEQQKLGVTVLDTHGKLLPLGDIIGQLHDKIKGLGPAQATAELAALGFGSSAAKILPVIEAGSKAYNDTTAAVTKTGTAHTAAAKMAATLSVEFKTIKAAAEDLLTKLGQVLIPIVESVVKVFAKFIGFLLTHKPILYTVAAVIGTVLVGAIGAYIISLGQAALASAASFGEMIADAVRWVAFTAVQVAEWLVVNGMMIAGYAAAAAAATAAFIAENAASLGIIAGIALLVGAIIWMATHWKEVWGFVKRIAMDVWHFLDGIWHDIVDAAVAAWDFLKSHLKVIIEAIFIVITGPIGLLVAFLVTHWKQILHDVMAGWNAVVAFLSAVPGKILSFFTGALSWLMHVGKDILNGMLNGIVDGAKALWHWWQNLSVVILNYVAGAARWLIKTGMHLLEGLWHGIVNGAKEVWHWFTSLPGDILGLLANAGEWLLHAGENIIHGLVNGIKGAAHHAWNAIKDVAHGVMHFFTDPLSIFSPSKVFEGYGKNLIEGLKNGLDGNANIAHDSVGKVADVFKSLEQQIEEIFANTDTWLVSAGANLVQGFAHGISSATGEVTTALGKLQSAAQTPPNVTAASLFSSAVGSVFGLGGGTPTVPTVTAPSSGAGGTIVLQVTTPIQINGQTLAQTVTQYQLRSARGTGTVLGQYSGGSQTGAATRINVNAISR